MIKYFHELTKGEFHELCKHKITWKQCAKKYPQPEWCVYPDAVCGFMGCWSLFGFMVTGKDYCKGCEHFKDKPIPPNVVGAV